MARVSAGWAIVVLWLAVPRAAWAGDDMAKFEGKWKGVAQVNEQSITIESIHDSKGYKNYMITPAGSVPANVGTFSAADGNWTAKETNASDWGTYQFIGADSVLCRDIAGNVVLWQRDNTPLPALAPGAAPKPPAPNAPGPNPAPNPPAGPGPHDVTPALRQVIEAKMKQGDYEGAWQELFKIQSWLSKDPDTFALDAAIRVGMQQWDVARSEAAVAMEFPGHLDDPVALRAYIQAQAAMGYVAHARSDLQRYQSLKLPDAAGLEKSLNDLASQPPGGCAPEQIASQFEALCKLAGRSNDAEELVRQATVLFKGVNNIRKTEFDTYLDRKRALTAAAETEPQTPAKWATLAQFLLDESQQLHGNTGFGYKAFFSFRAANPPVEQQQAIACCDRALRLDARSAQAHAVKAGALLELGQDDAAGNEITAALQIDPNEPKVLKLLSNLMTKRSWANTSAGDQYSAPTITEDEEYIYIHQRSDADLAQARYFYGLANQQMQTATNALQATSSNTQGSGDSCYYAAALAIRDGNKDAAVANMEKAVALAPDNGYFHMYLGKLYGQLHRPDLVGSWTQYSAGDNLCQTSANKLVNLAWHQLRLRDYDGARQTLDQAMRIDPADPHVAAYIALMRAGQSKDQRDVDQSAAYLAAAWALNQAYLRMVGGRQASAILKYGPEDVGLEMGLAASAAQRLLRLNRPQLAYGILSISLADGARVDSAGMNRPLRTAALPIPAVQDPTVPGPHGMENVKIAELRPMTFWLRTAHQLAAASLTAMGQRDAAARESAQAAAIHDVVDTNINPGRASDAPLRRR
ncbi:MAG TPA: hypothetical protein VGI81_21670 [Tepidisphaeraceae bacterium]